MEIQLRHLRVRTDEEARRSITMAASAPLIPISFKERAHSSSLADYVDLTREGSLDAPPLFPQAEPPPERGSEAPPRPPTTETPI